MLKNFKTFTLAVKFYQLCKKLKLNRVLYDQLYRASASICLNLAEGYGKPTFNDQRKFYYISMGSLRECEAIIIMENLSDLDLLETMDRLGGSLFKLCKSNTPFLEK
jgi:four helix bundle protein